MRHIYTSAREVHCWLGTNEPLLPVLHTIQYPAGPTPEEWTSVQSQMSALEEYICNNDYWSRAWIIQEIFLANNVIVLADSVSYEFNTLHWRLDSFEVRWQGSRLEQFRPFASETPQTRTQSNHAKKLYHGASLISLLANVYDQVSELPRDRVFSMLSLCGEGCEAQVDYKSPDSLVAFNVLQCCTLRCVCIPLLVTRCLDLQRPDSGAGTGFHADEPYLEVYIPLSRFSRPISHQATRPGSKRTFPKDIFCARGRYYRIYDIE